MANNAARQPVGVPGLWWGYLPLVVVAALFAGMVVLVPSDLPNGSAAGNAREVAEGQPASGWGETVTACADRALQVEGDGYSPPCFAFEGTNGGATSRGVTADEITVSYRMTADPNLLKILADQAGIPLDETPEDLVRTAEGLVDYFNQNFQFYGRQIRLERVSGSGSVITELTGGGQDRAVNDALKVADETQAFADVTALTQPYADALSDNAVVNIGAPYMSREWFVDRRPYAWSNFPDCTVSSEASSEVAVQAILGHPAKYAGGDLADRDRTLAIVAPNNLEYQQCVDAAVEVIEGAGHEIAHNLDYILDLATIPDTARSMIAQLKSEGVTSVALACDPIMASALAATAETQNYEPEWLVVGVGFNDLDLVGQIIAKNSGDQWSRAFGGTPWGAQQAFGTSIGYQAYKSVRDDEPSLLIDIVYFQLLELAIGLQMAGPDLTPTNFETGMFAYPEGTGTAGTWDFEPEHYTGVVDIRVFWWDPAQPSLFNNDPGAYVDDGTRVRQGDLPEGELGVFR